MSKHVLIVSENANKNIIDIFDALSILVTETKTLESTLAAIKMTAFDVILIDIFHYPDTGLDYLYAIKHNCETNAKMFIMSDSEALKVTTPDWERMNRLVIAKGAEGLISTPTTSAELTKILSD